MNETYNILVTLLDTLSMLSTNPLHKIIPVKRKKTIVHIVLVGDFFYIPYNNSTLNFQ